MPDATLSNTSLGRLAWLWLTVLIVVVDQASKYYFENALSLYQQIIVIPDYFSWTLAYNTGAPSVFWRTVPVGSAGCLP